MRDRWQLSFPGRLGLIILILGASATGLAAPPATAMPPRPRASGQVAQVGYVDLRVLTAFHPLMARYDRQTRTVRDTPAAGVTDHEAEARRLASRSAELLAELAELERRVKPLLASSGKGEATAIYQEYWRERQSIQGEVEMVQQAMRAAAVSGNYHEGTPPADFMMPVAMRISTDIRTVLQHLQRQHQLACIIDVSVLERAGTTDEPGVATTLPSNAHWAWWGQLQSAADGDPGAFPQWLRAARPRLAAVLPGGGHRPVVAGGIDLTLEALRALRRQPPPPATGGQTDQR